MVLAKKQLSKVVAIVLVAMCAVAFMPLLNGQAFAAAKAKKPAKVTVQSAKQVTNTMKVKVTWKKAKNAKKYNIKIDKKVVKKNVTKLNYTSGALKAGKHKVYVQGVNGKKKGKWSKAKTFTIVDKAAAAVIIEGNPCVGQTLTAIVTNKAGKELTSGVTYQWYRVNNFTGVVAKISGATKSTYVIVDADSEGHYTIFVEAKSGGKTVTSDPTNFVTSSIELASAAIVLPNGHTAPQLGDKLELEIKDTLGYEVNPEDVNLEIKWFAGEKEVAEGATWTVPADDPNKAVIGKEVTAKVTGLNRTIRGETYGITGEVTTPATAPIIASTTPERVKVDFSAAAPFVGETVNAVFEPEGTSDAAATYQWYRGTAKIAGATGATYTVTASDKGSTLKVEATLSIKDVNGDTITLTSAATPAVKEALTGAAITVASSGTPVSVFRTADNAVASVKDQAGQAITDTTFTYAWYLDSVADENQIFSTPYEGEGTAQTAAGANGTLALSDNAAAAYYPYKGTTALRTLVGHQLVAVASTDEASAKQGSVTSEATAAVVIALDNTAAAVTGDTGRSGNAGNYTYTCIATKTTLTVAANVQEDATISYKWFKSSGADADADYAEIAGQTEATYAIPAGDIGVKFYKVEITGTGDYYGTKTAKLTVAGNEGVVANTGQNVTVNTVINGGDPAEASTTTQPGNTLTASVSVAAAAAYVQEYTWTYTTPGVWPYVAGTTTTATGETFTVPTDAPANATVSLAVTFKADATDYRPGTSARVTVRSKINSVTITNPDATIPGTTADPGHDGVANPNVGETLRATIDPNAAANNGSYQWYAGEAKIQGATSATYTLQPEDIGQVIRVTFTGTGQYAGGAVASDPTGAVNAVGGLDLQKNGAAYNHEAIAVGDTMTAKVYAYRFDRNQKDYVKTNIELTDMAMITWTVDGKNAATGASWKPEADDATKAWKCTVTGVEPYAEGALIEDNGLEIEPAL